VLLGEFRRKAEECYAWAQKARSADEWLAWLNMAQLWLGLAQKAEARDAATAPPDVVDPKPPVNSAGSTAPEDQPAGRR
jgi:hypothetical protein